MTKPEKYRLIREANLTAALLLGTAPGALVTQPVSRFIVRNGGTRDLRLMLTMTPSAGTRCWP